MVQVYRLGRCTSKEIKGIFCKILYRTLQQEIIVHLSWSVEMLLPVACVCSYMCISMYVYAHINNNMHFALLHCGINYMNVHLHFCLYTK